MIFILGLLCGYVFAVYGSYSLERGYVREGIAKLCGKYYRLTPLNKEGEDNGK